MVPSARLLVYHVASVVVILPPIHSPSSPSVQEMVLSAHLLVYHLSAGGRFASDSLTFFPLCSGNGSICATARLSRVNMVAILTLIHSPSSPYVQEMVPSARLLVYHVASGGHIAADSLTFPVISTPGKQVKCACPIEINI